MDTYLNAGLPFIGADASRIGISTGRLKTLYDLGQVRRVVRGVYVDSRCADSRRLRAAALHLVKPPNAVFYGATAAFLRGVDVFPPGDRFNFAPQCMVPHHTSRCRRPLVKCREGKLPTSDLEVIEGLVTTTALRTTVDLLRSLWRPHALGAADAMAHAGLVLPDEVREYVSAMRHFPGIVQARSLVSLIEPLVESPGESAQRLRLIDAGFPVPTAQFSVFDRAGVLLAVLDGAYKEARVGIDYDGREFHTDKTAVEHDTWKREYLTTILSWRLAVATRSDIFGNDPSYEIKVGKWLGIEPRLPRRW